MRLRSHRRPGHARVHRRARPRGGRRSSSPGRRWALPDTAAGRRTTIRTGHLHRRGRRLPHGRRGRRRARPVLAGREGARGPGSTVVGGDPAASARAANGASPGAPTAPVLITHAATGRAGATGGDRVRARAALEVRGRRFARTSPLTSGQAWELPVGRVGRAVRWPTVACGARPAPPPTWRFGDVGRASAIATLGHPRPPARRSTGVEAQLARCAAGVCAPSSWRTDHGRSSTPGSRAAAARSAAPRRGGSRHAASPTAPGRRARRRGAAAARPVNARSPHGLARARRAPRRRHRWRDGGERRWRRVGAARPARRRRTARSAEPPRCALRAALAVRPVASDLARRCWSGSRAHGDDRALGVRGRRPARATSAWPRAARRSSWASTSSSVDVHARRLVDAAARRTHRLAGAPSGRRLPSASGRDRQRTASSVHRLTLRSRSHLGGRRPVHGR